MMARAMVTKAAIKVAVRIMAIIKIKEITTISLLM
jgi:hypothetical protein